MTRREWLASASGTLAAQPAESSRVAIARCRDYGPSLLPALKTMCDQLGGLGRLARNKTVALKINMTGGARLRMGAVPNTDAQYTHPAVIGALIHLLDQAGARRIRVLEGAYACADPLGEFMYDAGWDPSLLTGAGRNVVLENTNVAGAWKQYARFPVPGGGLAFPAYLLNKAYAESDLLVSVTKMKEHGTCGVTLAMKNLFGCTPISIYGDAAGKDDPNEDPRGGRGVILHSGRRQPARIAPAERYPDSSRNDRYRVPRIVADLTAALSVGLSVLDGIRTMAGGEGPWIRGVRPVQPGLLVAGLNPVSTDAAAMALMGFDPLATRGAPPFEQCDSTLELAESLGAGTRDLSRLEIAGAGLRASVFRFRG